MFMKMKEIVEMLRVAESFTESLQLSSLLLQDSFPDITLG